MSSSRRHADKRRANRKAVAPARIASRRTAYDQWPFKGPALGTVRTWLKQAEAEGKIVRAGVRHTGKPGRPAHLWGPPEGEASAEDMPSLADQRRDLQARKVARMHALSYETARQVIDHAARS